METKKKQQISIYLAVNVTFKYITDARSYRHTTFTILLKRKAKTHVLIARQQTETSNKQGHRYQR